MIELRFVTPDVKIDHFRDVLLSQSLSIKNKPNTTKADKYQ